MCDLMKQIYVEVFQSLKVSYAREQDLDVA
jgi:hypothetical protein